MALRNNRLLKTLALLLFTMEFLLPVLFTTACVSVSKNEFSFHKEHHEINIPALLAEEVEEEREGKNFKHTLSIPDFTLIATYSWPLISFGFHSSSSEQYKCIKAPIPLFKLYQVFQV